MGGTPPAGSGVWAGDAPRPGWSPAAVSAMVLGGADPHQVAAAVLTHPDPASAVRANPALAGPVVPAAVAPAVPHNAFCLVAEPSAWWPRTAVRGRVPLLFGVGDPAALTGTLVSVTGTRSPQRYGTAVAHAAAEAITFAQANVVCGGAAGVDDIVSRAVFQLGGKTVVVSAADPATHPWRSRVAENDAIVSRWPFGAREDGNDIPGATLKMPPIVKRLLDRNHDIVAFGSPLIVVAGGMRTGTSSAAWHAFAEGRPLVVAKPKPHAASDPDAVLPHALAHPARVNLEQLRNAGATKAAAQRLAPNGWAQGPLASAVADDTEELAAIITVLAGLAPSHTPTSTAPLEKTAETPAVDSGGAAAPAGPAGRPVTQLAIA